jgi:lipid-binding SYLF domain-containing protein
MKRIVLFMLFLALAALPAAPQDKEKERLENVYIVLKEIMDVPDNIPQELIDKAECVLVIPGSKKGAFIFGARYGRGAITCRTGANFDGPWSTPAMYRLYQGSFGLQIGGQETDFVLLVMNKRGASSILTSKAKLGGEASVAGGPKGRSAEASTNEQMRAEVLTYSRSRGVFAGLSLEGANLQSSDDDNKSIYGRKYSAREIVREGKVPATAEGQRVIQFLNAKSPKNLSADN